MNKSIVEINDFKYNPMDIRSTFLSLVRETYPYGYEDELLKFLPDLKKDEFGNYYMIIGSNPLTMFTSHLDTYGKEKNDIVLYSYIENDEEFITTDGNSILGADDKAGVTVMLYMIENKVPGIYYFFIGEEVGALGSEYLKDNYKSIEHFKNINKCISFDRKGVESIITSQSGVECCSIYFTKELSSEYKKNGLNMKSDNTGIFSDSANLMDIIPECTNISVGYFNEHTNDEKQNITFLSKLCKASVSVDWEHLAIERRIRRIKNFKNFNK